MSADYAYDLSTAENILGVEEGEYWYATGV
jgi:hypothetical protein